MAILYTAGVPASPAPGIPTPPDLSTGLRDQWTFDHLDLADGAEIPPPGFVSTGGSNGDTLATHTTTPAQRPRLAVAALNGHNVATFVGTEKQFARGPILAGDDIYPVPIIRSAVFRRVGAVSEILWTGGPDAGGVSRGVQIGLPANSLVRISLLGATGSIDPAIPIDDAWHTVVAVFDGANSSITVDGVTTRGTLDTTQPTANHHARDVIGSNAAASANYFTGQIACLRAFSRAQSFTATDIVAETNRLRQTYGL